MGPAPCAALAIRCMIPTGIDDRSRHIVSRVAGTSSRAAIPV
jgi:hypothetical protein